MSMQSQTTDVDLEAFEELFKWEEELLKLEEEVKKTEMQKQKPPPREFEPAPGLLSKKQQDDFDEMINGLKIDLGLLGLF